jgi:hypothetical protein
VNTGSPVFLDEYTPSGTLVQSMALPTSVSGSNKQLIASGTASSEGLLTLSSDGRYLFLTGYAANIGGTASLSGTTGIAIPRTVGRVDASGNIDTSTALTDFATGNNPRSAELITWGNNNGYNFTASAATGKIPEDPALDGFNVEGLTIAPNGTTAYIAFRAPQVPTSARTKALIAPVTNFTDLVTGAATSANIGAPIELDLGGRGIREISRNSSGQYLIIERSTYSLGFECNQHQRKCRS